MKRLAHRLRPFCLAGVCDAERVCRGGIDAARPLAPLAQAGEWRWGRRSEFGVAPQDLRVTLRWAKGNRGNCACSPYTRLLNGARSFGARWVVAYHALTYASRGPCWRASAVLFAAPNKKDLRLLKGGADWGAGALPLLGPGQSSGGVQGQCPCRLKVWALCGILVRLAHI